MLAFFSNQKFCRNFSGNFFAMKILPQLLRHFFHLKKIAAKNNGLFSMNIK